MPHSAPLCLLILSMAAAAPARADANAPAPAPAEPAGLPAAHVERIDKLFAPWDSPVTPGGVVAVIRDGRVVHRRAFGMADLDFDHPNTPDTRFHIASVSKQFTAMAVLLLRQDGKLSLDDDVRKFVPELPDFGKTITLRHLVHHTSGLRDQPHLMWMAGWRFEDQLTTGDVLRLFGRQRSLHFTPGDESLYCNTGYTLLAVAAERAAGVSLARFSRERIFEPLGMTDTLIQDDHHQVVKRRARSYRPAKGGGYEGLPLSDSTVGQTGVVTTVGDFARWDQNFYDGRVGGKDLVAGMIEPGRLNNGQPSRYAAGLGVGDYRGLPIVEHSGSVAAYRSHYLRFPAERFSVIVMANAEDLPATELAHRIADICLEGGLKPPAAAPAGDASPPAAVDLPPAVLDAYVGDYRRGPGNFVTVSRDGGNLMAQGTGSGRVPLTPASQTLFLLPRKGATVTFVKPEGAARAESIRLGVGGKDDETAERVDPPPSAGLVGDYYSPELDVIYHVEPGDPAPRAGRGADTALRLLHPRGAVEMKRTVPDSYDLPFPLKSVRFDRDPTGRATAFMLDAERARQVRFGRIDLGPRH